MLHSLLPEYPNDFIRRPSYYRYGKSLDICWPTMNEVELLNRINAQHSHWAYSRQPFTTNDELVSCSDFIPYYEHLCTSAKMTSTNSNFAKSSAQSNASLLLQSTHQTSDFSSHIITTGSSNLNISTKTKAAQTNPYSLPGLQRDTVPTVVRDMPQTSNLFRSSQPSKRVDQSWSSLKHSSGQLLQSSSSMYTKDARPVSSCPSTESADIALTSQYQTAPVSNTSLQSSKLIPEASSVSTSSVASSSTTMSNKEYVTTSSEQSLGLLAKLSPSSSNLHSGWLQINKLYTPYISPSTSNHHLYKIPVSLLTFYELLKSSSTENNSNASKDSPFSNEPTLVTQQEIELINELCLKQNIKPFSIDTKLMDLLTFYQNCSTNVIFIKELPLNDPKASICKDWMSIVQINGGICRLRNITTLHEQTVPFIGNNLLKNFIISSQYLTSATLTTPTTAEIEFLQLILFFSNMSINLRNAKLIDIESVRKEYNVDLILLFNDKFPLNVLNYQSQVSAPSSTSQGQANQSDSSAATNMFAESTPPPSPLSPSTNKVAPSQTCQIPLISSISTSSNRYQKTITFHGQPVTAYICSGLESNVQRECIPIRVLCNIFHPESFILDRVEAKLLRLLRLKKINRFRPQNQQTLNYARLVDIQDVEKHWDYLEKGMHSIFNSDETPTLSQENRLTISDLGFKATIPDKSEHSSSKIELEISGEVDKNNKRPLESESHDQSIIENLEKYRQYVFNDVSDQSKLILLNSPKPMESYPSDATQSDPKLIDNDETDKIQLDNYEIERVTFHKMTLRQNDKENKNEERRRSSNESLALIRRQIVPVKKKIKLTRRKRKIPRSHKQSIASWVQKYNIEDCCIVLDWYDPNAEPMEM